MGDKRSSRRKDKEKRRKRSRTPSSDSSSSRSDRSSSRRRSKKIKKKSSSNKREVRQIHPMFPLPTTPYFNPFIASMIAPPPPAPTVTTTTTKISKAKQSNIFKILPQLGWSSIMFCNTIIDPELFGLENYDQMINKMWKRLQRRIKSIPSPGTDRLLKKMIPQGIATHDRIVSKIKQSLQKKQMQKMTEPPLLKYSDFQILKAYYQQRPIEQIKKMIGPENTVKLPNI